MIAGKYKVEALLGRGAMGSVYAARNQGTGKRVALKWLLTERQADMEMIARFEREARAAGRIDHPNVVTIYDVGRDGPSSFLVMELLKGYSLLKLMKQGPIPPDAAVQLIMPVIRGIGAAHDNQVIHRDLKPENIFVCVGPDGTPRNTKVLDFGVSKMTDEMREGLSVTRTGMIIGTPYYMAPEQIRGLSDFDHRIDIYAAGVILYEMIAGRPPFVAENYSGLVLEIATGTPPDIRELCPGIDEALVEVIDRAMEREREDRFQDARSFGLALEPFADGLTYDLRGAEWTQKIKLPRASTPPPDKPVFLAESQAATLAEDTTELEASGERPSRDELMTSLERPDSKSGGDRVDEDAPTNAWHETSGDAEIKTAAPTKRKPLLIVGLGVAMILIASIAVMSLSSDDPEGTGADTEAVELTTAVDEPAVNAEEETEARVVTEEVAEELADEPAEVAAPSTDLAEGEEAEAATAAVASARRRRGRMAMSAVMQTTDSPMEPTGMSGHRAGSLSLEDF